MGELPSPIGAFDKLKSLLMKLIPIFGVVVGIFAFRFIGQPIATAIRNFLIKQFKFSQSSTAGGFKAGDFQELLWWVPAGIIVGSIAAVIGTFLRGAGGDILPILGNFALGFAFGALLGGVLFPFREDIPFLNVILG